MNRIETYSCRIKGVTFYNERYGNDEYRQTIIDDLYHKKLLEKGQLLRLKLEPDNQYDPKAVAIFGPDGRQLGYIPQEGEYLANLVFDHISQDHYCEARVDRVVGGSNSIRYDVYISIDVYDSMPDYKPEYLKEEVNNKIIRIEVDNLFGLYSYNLNLKNDISIFYGMNGRGKSTIMRLIKDVISGNAEKAFEVPFDRFQLTLSNGAVIALLSGENQNLRIIDFDRPKIGCNSHAEFVEDDAAWRDCLMNCLEDMRIHLIPADRLYKHSEGYASKERVQECRKLIAEAVRYAKNSFLGASETLGTSFPYRALKNMEKKESQFMSASEINSEMHKLEARREELDALGMLQRREIHVDDKPYEIRSDASEDMLRMMSLYIDDSWAKYAVFDDVYERLCLFMKIINEEHRYLNKKLAYDFTNEADPLWFELPDGKKLALEKLSSGEKNDFILFSELIFGSFANTVILIDEPEISLHVAWQRTILNELIEISGMNGFQVVVATHSPSIVGKHWDKAIELGYDEEDDDE